MNILDAFIKKYSQLIILILGLPCTNKSEIAKELEIDLKLPTLNINDYLIKDKFKEVEFSNIKFKIYDDTDNYDWDKLNNDDNKLKSSGVILYGNYIDSSKIDFNYDFAFFYSLNTYLCKKILIEKKLLKIEEVKNERIYFENIFVPKYEKLKKDIKFKKFFNIKEDTLFNDSYDEIFDLLMTLIKSRLRY
jgi:hypothetical protein